MALALLVTGGVGYYSFSSATGAPPPATHALPLPAPTSHAAAGSFAPASVAMDAPGVVAPPLAAADDAPLSGQAALAKAAARKAQAVLPQLAPRRSGTEPSAPAVQPAAPLAVSLAAADPAPVRRSRRITGRFLPVAPTDEMAPRLADAGQPLEVPPVAAAAMSLEPPLVPVPLEGAALVSTPGAPAAPAETGPAASGLAATSLPAASPPVTIIAAPTPAGAVPAAIVPPAATEPAAVPAAEPVAARLSPAPGLALAPAAIAPARTNILSAAAKPTEPRAAYTPYRLADGSIEFALRTRIDGSDVGALPLRIGQGDRVTLRLGDLLAVLQPRMDPVTYARLSNSRASDEYVGLDSLRKAGIAVRFDAARDELVMGTAASL